MMVIIYSIYIFGSGEAETMQDGAKQPGIETLKHENKGCYAIIHANVAMYFLTMNIYFVMVLFTLANGS